MVSEALVTVETVAIAAAALTERGERPSVNAVRQELGGGSPNRILEHLQTWRARPTETAGEAVVSEFEPKAMAVRADLPDDVAASVEALVRSVVAAVDRVEASGRRSAAERLDSMAAAHSDALSAQQRQQSVTLAAVEARLADAVADLKEALPSVQEAEELLGRVVQLVNENAELRERVGALDNEFTSAAAVIAEAVAGRSIAEVAAERAADEAMAWRTELARAQQDLADIRLTTARAASSAQTLLDTARGELTELRTAGRAQAEEIDRLRTERAASEDRARGLCERAAAAEAKLSAMQTTPVEAE